MNQEKYSKDSCYLKRSFQVVLWLIKGINDSQGQKQAKCLLKQNEYLQIQGGCYHIFDAFHVAPRDIHACMFM